MGARSKGSYGLCRNLLQWSLTDALVYGKIVAAGMNTVLVLTNISCGASEGSEKALSHRQGVAPATGVSGIITKHGKRSLPAAQTQCCSGPATQRRGRWIHTLAQLPMRCSACAAHTALHTTTPLDQFKTMTVRNTMHFCRHQRTPLAACPQHVHLHANRGQVVDHRARETCVRA